MYKKYQTLRDKLEISDYQVAKATGIPKSTFSEWKNGKYNPKIEKIIKIANFFGVSVDYFLNDSVAT